MKKHWSDIFLLLLSGLFMCSAVATPAIASWPTDRWHVRCAKNGWTKKMRTMECDRKDPSSAVAFAEETLKEASRWYDQQGFLPPLLPEEYGLWTHTFLLAHDTGGDDGYYDPGAHELYISESTHFNFERGKYATIPFTTPVHELFHAIQFSYPSFNKKDDVPDWITEGTANAAGEIWAHDHDGSRDYFEYSRRYDRPLASPVNAEKDPKGAYGTSSFWEWIAIEKNSGSLGYLATVFEQPDLVQGDGITGVDAALRKLGWGGLFHSYPQFITWVTKHPSDKTQAFAHCPTLALNENKRKATFSVRTVRPVAALCYEVRTKVPPDASYELVARIKSPKGIAADQIHLTVDGEVADGKEATVWIDNGTRKQVIGIANVAAQAAQTKPEDVVLEVELRPMVWYAHASGRPFSAVAGGGVAVFSIDKERGAPATFPVFGVPLPKQLARDANDKGMLKIDLSPYRSLGEQYKYAIDTAKEFMAEKTVHIPQGIRKVSLYVPGISKLVPGGKTGKYKAYISLETPKESYQDVADFSVPSAPFVPDISIRRPLTGTVTLTKVDKGLIQGTFAGRLIEQNASDRLFDGHSCPGSRHWGAGVHRCPGLELHISGVFRANQLDIAQAVHAAKVSGIFDSSVLDRAVKVTGLFGKTGSGNGEPPGAPPVSRGPGSSKHGIPPPSVGQGMPPAYPGDPANEGGASSNPSVPAKPGMGLSQPGGGGVRLTDDVMRRFLAVVKDLQAEGQSVRQGKGSIAAAMAYNAGMESILKAHGFTPQDWATTLGLVTSAMAGMEIKKETSDPNLNAQFEAQRKSIEQAKDLSPAAKKQILQQMEQQEKNMMAARHHADPNEAAVRPYLEQLQAVFGK